MLFFIYSLFSNNKIFIIKLNSIFFKKPREGEKFNNRLWFPIQKSDHISVRILCSQSFRSILNILWQVYNYFSDNGWSRQLSEFHNNAVKIRTHISNIEIPVLMSLHSLRWSRLCFNHNTFRNPQNSQLWEVSDFYIAPRFYV